MKALVGVKTQASEFSWTEDGELLWQNPVVCCSSRTCGCNRAMSGVDTLCNTTTAKVAETELDESAIEKLAAKVAKRSGYPEETVLPCLQGAIDAAQEFELDTIVTTRWVSDRKGSGHWAYTSVESS